MSDDPVLAQRNRCGVCRRSIPERYNTPRRHGLVLAACNDGAARARGSSCCFLTHGVRSGLARRAAAHLGKVRKRAWSVTALALYPWTTGGMTVPRSYAAAAGLKLRIRRHRRPPIPTAMIRYLTRRRPYAPPDVRASLVAAGGAIAFTRPPTKETTLAFPCVALGQRCFVASVLGRGAAEDDRGPMSPWLLKGLPLNRAIAKSLPCAAAFFDAHAGQFTLQHG